MWLNRRSREKAPARTRLGGSLTGSGGTRSITVTILIRKRPGFPRIWQAEARLTGLLKALVGGGHGAGHHILEHAGALDLQNDGRAVGNSFERAAERLHCVHGRAVHRVDHVAGLDGVLSPQPYSGEREHEHAWAAA